MVNGVLPDLMALCFGPRSERPTFFELAASLAAVVEDSAMQSRCGAAAGGPPAQC